MNRRSVLTIVVGLLLILGVLAVDVVAPPPDPAEQVAVEPAAITPVAGTSTCAVGDGREGTDLAVSVARPGELADGPAELEIVGFEGGEERRRPAPPLFPGIHAFAAVDGGEEQATSVSWRGGPVAVERTWQLREADELPPGTVAGPCPSTVSDRWVVPGMITVGGSEARLRVANPFASDATVAVGFVTPEGPEQPLALQNLSVPARGTLELDVNEFLPERADLSAVVRILSGRAVVEGYQLTRAAIGDIDGASLLAASTAPSETWTVPWVSDSEADDAWLWVVNLGDRPAPVELTLHTEDGGIPPAGLSEVTVAPGQLRRIDLRGTLPEGVPTAGVTARSDGAPIHVSGVVQRRGADAAGSGFVVQLGVPASDDRWIVTGGPLGEGRRELLEVLNPGSEAAELSVTLFDGSSVVRPAELDGLTVGPGGRLRLDLQPHLTGARSWSAFLTTSAGEVVVGRIGLGGHDDGLHLVATPGTPSSAWGAPVAGLPSSPAIGTVQRLGTSLGVQPRGPLGDDLDRPSPPPSPLPDAEAPDADAEDEDEEEGAGAPTEDVEEGGGAGDQDTVDGG
jgi:hypothetical protein